MSLSRPRSIFGVHSVAPYNVDTGEFYGIAKVVGEASLAQSGDLVKLIGGSSKYPWAIETGMINSSVKMKLREFPDILFQLTCGKAVTSNSAETAGNVSTLTNKYGSSLVNATTGVATAIVIPSTGAANLKFGKYVVKAVSASTVDVFVGTDIDFARGTDGSYTTDLLKIAAAQSVTTGANTDLSAYGIRLTGGSGTIGLTTGDTATFEVRPINTASTLVTVGSVIDTYPEFGILIYAQKQGTGEMVELDVFRCKGIGVPFGMSENAFAEPEINVEAFYDSTRDGVFSFRHVKPSTVS